MDEKESKNRVKVQYQSSLGLVWFGGWLFTIGYLQLKFWSGLLALFIWPYYLGDHWAPSNDIASKAQIQLEDPSDHP